MFWYLCPHSRLLRFEPFLLLWRPIREICVLLIIKRFGFFVRNAFLITESVFSGLQHSDRSIILLHLSDSFTKAFPIGLRNSIVVDDLYALTPCASIYLAQEFIDVGEGIAVE